MVVETQTQVVTPVTTQVFTSMLRRIVSNGVFENPTRLGWKRWHAIDPAEAMLDGSQHQLMHIQMPAVVRRGDLTIAVSTNGVSPALSRRLREHIAALFGPEWAGRVALLGALRRSWRRAQVPAAEIARRTVAAVESRGWLAGVGSGRDADRRRA